MKRTTHAALSGLLLAVVRPAVAQPDAEPLDLSFEELLQVDVHVPSAITKLRVPESPASVTVITAEDIARTPARNILDLIEIYVPGAFWLDHEDGPHIGVRGHIANRNDNYLLLVNGRVLNSKAHFGAKSELEHWDLGDIAQIEIVRGPGSVTYGPGAIAGVIRITTHDGASAPGTRVATRAVHRYNSVGASASHGYSGDRIRAYVYGSVTRTTGLRAPQFLVEKNGDAGFVGEDIKVDDEPLDYFADYQGQPQIKLHADATLFDDTRVWLRYTQQGSTWRGNEVKTEFDGELLNQQGVRDRQVTLTATHRHRLSERLEVQAMLSAGSFDAERRGESDRDPDPDHILNKKVDFSETEAFARATLNWDISRRAELAIGSEYSYDWFGPGWGDDRDDFRLGGDGNIVSNAESRAIRPGNNGSADRNDHLFFVGDGWFAHTVSGFAEARLTLARELKALVSARADKSSRSELSFSPRVALLAEPSRRHFVKLIAQRSVRVNTASELITASVSGEPDPDPEVNNTVELSYTGLVHHGCKLSATSYLQRAEVVQFDGDTNHTVRVGELDLFGFETEFAHVFDGGRFGASYAFLHQLDWDLADGVTGSGISYADYAQPLDDDAGVLTGVGQARNNWPNHSVKVFGDVTPVPRLTLHADAHLFWDYQGAKDGLEMLRRASVGSPEQAKVLRAIAEIENENVYGPNLRVNASAGYGPVSGVSFRLYVQNLFGTRGNKRHALDDGHDELEPRKIRYVEEPTAVWLTATYER